MYAYAAPPPNQSAVLKLVSESIFIIFILYELFNVSFVVKKCVCL